MSIKVMNEVWERSEAEGMARLVLLALADHADEETRSCWPSVRLVARKCRVHEDTARRHLHALQELGEISIEDQEGGTRNSGGRRPNRYVIRCYPSDTLQSATPCKTTTPRVDATPGPALVQPQAPRGREPNHQGTVKEPSPARSQANGAPKQRKEMHSGGKQILDEFYESRKKSGQPLVVKNWPEATRTIGRFLDEGVAPTRIRGALEIAPNISIGCLNIALDKLAKSTPADDRPSTWGVELATEEEVWE